MAGGNTLNDSVREDTGPGNDSTHFVIGNLPSVRLVDNALELLDGVAIAAIGPVTAKAIEKAGLKVDIMPGESTMEALADEIIKWASSRPGLL